MLAHWLHGHHRRMRQHHNFAVRFAYWNFLINSVFAVVWGVPVMALIFLDPQLASSVKWISFLSVWALLATHAGGAIAAFAAVHSAEDNERGAHDRRGSGRGGRRGSEPMGTTTSDDQGVW